MNTKNIRIKNPGPRGYKCEAFEDEVPLFQRNLKKGDRVWWSDPGEGRSHGYSSMSGVYTVDEVYDEDEDGERFSDTMVMLSNEAGSVAEVNLDELCAVPEGVRQSNPGAAPTAAGLVGRLKF